MVTILGMKLAWALLVLAGCTMDAARMLTPEQHAEGGCGDWTQRIGQPTICELACHDPPNRENMSCAVAVNVAVADPLRCDFTSVVDGVRGCCRATTVESDGHPDNVRFFECE